MGMFPNFCIYRQCLSAFKIGRNLRILQRRMAQSSALPSRYASKVSPGPLFVFFPSIFTLRILGFFNQEPKGEEKRKLKMEVAIAEADRLYDEMLHEKIYDLLHPLKDGNNEEVLWRLARSVYEKAKLVGTDNEKKALYQEGYEYVKKALEINESCFGAHKWMSILLDYVSMYEGTKERISQSFKVKEHMMRACELKPNDATSYYLLGYWCYTVADLPWYQRKIATVIFATPPTSSYEEALQYFEKGENIEPNFYSKNLLMLGKCYLKLGEAEHAKKFLLRARDFPARTDDDHQANKEATELLKGLKVDS